MPTQTVPQAKALTQPAATQTSFDWENAKLPEAHTKLAEIRAEAVKGAGIIERREAGQRNLMLKCHGCGGGIAPGRWAQCRTLRNPATQLLSNIYFCHERCISVYNKSQGGGLPAK